VKTLKRAAWLEIDLQAVGHNTRVLRQLTDHQARLMAIVKADAYGHGAVSVSRQALACGADWLGVATLDEALELRTAGIPAPILILGYTPENRAEGVILANVRQGVFEFSLAQALSRAATRIGRQARIHIKVDTGMGRIGFRAGAEAVAAVQAIAALPGIVVEGLFTHLAAADAADKSCTRRQLDLFAEVWQKLKGKGIHVPLRHAANSAAIIDLPESHLDMVRMGIALYGLYPSEEVTAARVELQPAMTLKARIIQVKEVPANTPISYGMTFVTPHPTRIATLPLGYADGYPRLFSNRAQVLVRGQRAPIVGRVCMDQLMVDVGSIPGVEAGEEVVLLGQQAGERLAAAELADWAKTIHYEIVTRMSPRLERICGRNSER